MSDRFSRRMFLAGLGGSAALLPLLQSRRSLGQGAGGPKRLVVFFTPNGTLHPHFWPQGDGTDFRFAPGSILEPLADLRDHLIIPAGLAMASASEDPNLHGGHDGMVHMLTGAPTTASETPSSGSESGFAPNGAGGVSVDQYIANRIAADTALPFASLETAVMVQHPHHWQRRLSWRGPGDARDPEENPYTLFDRLFASRATPPEMIDRLRLERRSILDHVGADLERFASQSGREDRDKIDAHLQSIRELERRFDPSTLPMDTCVVPTLDGTRIDTQEMNNYPRVGQMQMDLIAGALACDLTRVASIQWSNSGANNVVFSWLGSEFEALGSPPGECNGDCRSHHQMSHDAGHGDRDLPETWRRVGAERWYAEQFAYLLRKLDAIPEGDGTVLDNTVVLWTNSMSNGASHCWGTLPYVLAGGCGGSLRTGQYFRFGEAFVNNGWPAQTCGRSWAGWHPHNHLLVTLCHAMGYDDVSTFGDPAYGSGPGPLAPLLT